jgi:hypothetical protein
LTASFAWGQWQKPEIAALYARTAGALSDLRIVERAQQKRSFRGRKFLRGAPCLRHAHTRIGGTAPDG